MNYFFNSKARIEHLEHVAYYESQKSGLGARYLAAFDASMLKICNAPHHYKIEFPPNIRRYKVPGFPYTILFRQTEADIEVLVVAPQRRRPDYWLGRL